MSAYIYTVMSTQTGKVEVCNVATRKWVVVDYIKDNFLGKGLSIAPLTIIRSIDGRAGSGVSVDPYEFMNIDLGEE